MTDKENNFAKDINVPSKEQTNGSLKNQDKNFNENFTQDKEQIKHKVCKYQYYWSDEVGCDGWWCENPERKNDIDCPHFPSETHNCKFYVEGEDYE